MIFTPRPAQQKILTYTGGRMGISAVPGSGKTHTLSALAAQLIRSGRIGDEQEVLIVTLVNSAVDNFSARIKDFLGLSLPFGYRVRTLHGLAHDLVREKPGSVGLEERFRIVDERESDQLRREAVRGWLDANPGRVDEWLKPDLSDSQLYTLRHKELANLFADIAEAFIRTAKDRRLSPEQVRSLLEAAPAPLPLAEMGLAVYSDYQRGLLYRTGVDFDDLIRLAIDLLENDSEYLERLRYRWPFILEDEAQDSSRLQEQILRLLAGPAGNWVRVGDPNQAIFETFTTASPQHLLDFIHKEADQYHELPDSGRCQPSIIQLANDLIRWVNDEHPVEAVRDALTIPFILPTAPDDPQPNPPDDPNAVRLIPNKYAPAEEIGAVVRSIVKWLPEHPDSTIAVLVPRNQRGTEVIEALKEKGIEFVELLGSTSSTRLAASRLSDIFRSLSEPQAPARLAEAYLAWRKDLEPETGELQRQVASLLHKCDAVEAFTSPHPGADWLAGLEGAIIPEALEELKLFQGMQQRWHKAVLLPVDQLLLTVAQEIFTSASDLALAHKLALLLSEAARDHADWRLPELTGELGVIARNERRFLGFSEDDSGFDPSHHPGKVVVTTMHKAKGLEWDRVYMLSVNNYDFPSALPGDRYISEKWYIRDELNLQAEALAQLELLGAGDEYHWYTEGEATRESRLDYVRERLRLLYVGITRARKELVITWNTGRNGNQVQAIPLVGLSKE